MNNQIDNGNSILTEWDNFEYKPSITENWRELSELEPKLPNQTTSTYEDLDDSFITPAKNNKTLKEQVDSLSTKLLQAYNIIKKERAEKQNTVKLLKAKLHELQSLHFKINKMNENIKCCQEHIAIERNNYKTTENKMTYITSKLQAAEKTISQKDKIIQNLKVEHEESMRRTKMLIEEFYRYKFLEEITYADLENIKPQQIELMELEDSYA